MKKQPSSILAALFVLLLAGGASAQSQPLQPPTGGGTPPPATGTAQTSQPVSQPAGQFSVSGKKFFLNGGVQLGLPFGNYSDITGFGIGLMVGGEMLFTNQLSFTGRIGFDYHLSKSYNSSALGVSVSTDTHWNNIPILVGAKYYVSGKRDGFYGAAEIGLYYLMFSSSYAGSSASSSDTKLGFTVGGGYKMGPFDGRLTLQCHSIGDFADMFQLALLGTYEFMGF
jgi:hypothetical protein